MKISSIFRTIFVLSSIFGDKADVIVWDNNLPWSNTSTILSVDYENDCVNIDPESISNRRSIDTNNTCITFYEGCDCEGNSMNFVSNQTFFPFLSKVHSVRQPASFKRCDNSEQQLRLKRPQYNFILHAGMKNESRSSRVYSIESGVCKYLPSEWRRRLVKFFTVFEVPVALFPDTRCENSSVRGYPNFNMSSNTHRYDDGDPVKSVQILDLKHINKACSFLKPGSKEYKFWLQIFSSSNDEKRSNEFKRHVDKSKGEFISWDFLFASDSRYHTTVAVDIDAIQSYIHLFGSSRQSELEKLGFTRDRKRFLAQLAYDVYLERLNQSNYVEYTAKKLFKFYVDLWMKMHIMLRPSKRDKCGQVESTGVRIQNGKPAVLTMNPWQAGIYRNITSEGFQLICSATLISATVLISAGHCFYDKSHGKPLNDTSEYIIALGKYTSNYNSSSGKDKLQSYHKVKELVFFKNGYDPERTGTEGSDIILIILENAAVFNKVIQPVCIDEDRTIFKSLGNGSTVGRVVGWGSTGPGTSDSSDILRTADFQYVSFTDCKGKIMPLFNDKFCVRSKEGAALRFGDSGGGLIFEHNNRYYVTGVVSEKDKTNGYAAFTDLTMYIDWIKTYLLRSNSIYRS